MRPLVGREVRGDSRDDVGCTRTIARHLGTKELDGHCGWGEEEKSGEGERSDRGSEGKQREFLTNVPTNQKDVTHMVTLDRPILHSPGDADGKMRPANWNHYPPERSSVATVLSEADEDLKRGKQPKKEKEKKETNMKSHPFHPPTPSFYPKDRQSQLSYHHAILYCTTTPKV